MWKGDVFSILRDEEVNYDFVHEDDVVTVLPYIEMEGKPTRFLIREEYIPPYFNKTVKGDKFYTALMGTIKNGEDSLNCLFRELKEEAGITLTGEGNWSLRCIKRMPICKTTDIRAYMCLISLDENGFVQGDALGDGSEYEKRSKSIWVKSWELETIIGSDNVDLILYSLYHKYRLEKR